MKNEEEKLTVQCGVVDTEDFHWHHSSMTNGFLKIDKAGVFQYGMCERKKMGLF